MQEAGYIPVATFTLPEKCWTDNYFAPREAALKALSDKYIRNKTVEAFIENNKYEVELYSKYKHYYGYVFYIGKKYKNDVRRPSCRNLRFDNSEYQHL